MTNNKNDYKWLEERLGKRLKIPYLSKLLFKFSLWGGTTKEEILRMYLDGLRKRHLL